MSRLTGLSLGIFLLFVNLLLASNVQAQEEQGGSEAVEEEI